MQTERYAQHSIISNAHTPSVLSLIYAFSIQKDLCHLCSNIRLAKLLDVLLRVRVVNVSRLKLGTGLLVNVEREAVIVVEGQTLLDAVHQVGSGDEATAKDDGNFVVPVLLFDGLDGHLCGEATGDEDGLLGAPGLQSKVKAVALRVTVDD